MSGLIKQVGGRSTGSIHGNAKRSLENGAMKTLDRPLSKRPMTDHVIWTTVEKDGVKFTVQLRVDNRLVEHAIASSIEAEPHIHTREIIEGNIYIMLTRQT